MREAETLEERREQERKVEAREGQERKIDAPEEQGPGESTNKKDRTLREWKALKERKSMRIKRVKTTHDVVTKSLADPYG